MRLALLIGLILTGTLAFAQQPKPGEELIGDPRTPGTLDVAKIQAAGRKASDAAEKLGWRLGSQAYTLRDRTLLDALDTLHMLGLRYVECYPGQAVSREMKSIKFDPNAPPEAVAAVKKKLDETGIKVLSLGVIGIDKDPAKARKLFEFAKSFGMERIVTEAPASQFDDIQKLAEEYNIDIALHNHPEPNIYGTPEKVLAAIKPHHKRIGACADVGHWQRSGVNPVEGLKKLEGLVFESHFKDLERFGVKSAQDVPWGTGMGNVKGMLEEALRQTKANKMGGNAGERKMTFNIEYEKGHGTQLVKEMAASIEYFGKVCEELAGQ
jgi:sugar phosphate isomerase/epimerase